MSNNWDYAFFKLIWKRFYLTFSESKHFTDKWITISIPFNHKKSNFESTYFLGCYYFQGFTISPTECFLNYLTIPEDENTPVDLRQSAVVIMAHLNRLCAPYLPPSPSQKVGLRRLYFCAWRSVHHAKYKIQSKNILCCLRVLILLMEIICVFLVFNNIMYFES